MIPMQQVTKGCGGGCLLRHVRQGHAKARLRRGKHFETWAEGGVETPKRIILSSL
jgi:hypothetical protein